MVPLLPLSSLGPEGIKAVAAGMNPMDLKRGIDLAVEKVLASLKEMTQPIGTKEEISSVSQTFSVHSRLTFVAM